MLALLFKTFRVSLLIFRSFFSFSRQTLEHLGHPQFLLTNLWAVVALMEVLLFQINSVWK